jgi:uncharacterized protein (TIGR00725 family)
MGPGEGASPDLEVLAEALGGAIARSGWVLLTGGRKVGVMAAATREAKAAGGLTIGLLPTATSVDSAPDLDLVIPTGLGHARNALNVLAAHAVVACGMGLGTASEVALALKCLRPVILLGCDDLTEAFFRRYARDLLFRTETVAGAIAHLKQVLQP